MLHLFRLTAAAAELWGLAHEQGGAEVGAAPTATSTAAAVATAAGGPTPPPQRYECVIELLTGRTHQIRAQLSAVGCPLLGDPLYQPLASAQLRQVGVHVCGWESRSCLLVVCADQGDAPPPHDAYALHHVPHTCVLTVLLSCLDGYLYLLHPPYLPVRVHKCSAC